MKQTYPLYFSIRILSFRLLVLLLIGGFLCPSSSFSQRVYRQFSTQSVDKQFRSTDESVIERRLAIERHVRQYQLNGTVPNFTIPIIFHHVYRDTPINPSAIEVQLAALNTAFQYTHDWEHPAHDILGIEALTPTSKGIQFCLADVDLMENGSIGYNYVPVNIEEWTIDGLVTTALSSNAIGGFDFTAFKPQNYLNVWIVDLPQEEAGYAQMPWSPKKSDGIVINRQLFEPSGNDFRAYTQGKTLVHLVGSYLGLYELWNDDKPCVDDRVFDTPIHNAPNYGANAEYRHISLCTGYPVEQTMNFMDATDDNNMYLFTKGQLLRVAAMLSKGGARAALSDTQSLCHNTLTTYTAAASRNTNLISTTNKQDFQIAPNPASDQITLTFPSAGDWHAFQIFNANGQLLHTIPVNSNELMKTIDCSTYPSGIYFVTANSSSIKQTKRFTLSK